MNKKYLLFGGGGIAAVVIAFFAFRSTSTGDSIDIMTDVKSGTFKVEIETTGELEAKNSVKVTGPNQLREYRVNQLTIQDIVTEGTVVQKGDWIATLDRSEFQGKIKDKEIELEKAQATFVQTQLDTTLQMRLSRDELVNLRYDVEERKIVLEQSKFEPPATIKQNEINLDKASRALSQALENYKIKRRQNVEKMRQVNAELRKVQGEYQGMLDLVATFRVMAPEPGMVIYRKGWDGKPIKAGSTVSTWDPVVATLPDLTVMMSKTYVNEVDVRKVKPGQNVEIGLDAYPDKQLAGTVMSVANVGEQRPNSDAKVFQVDIQIKGTDPSLRPAMTTSNKIIASVIEDAVFIPLECLHTEFDSITYVFKKAGIGTVKQEVMVGETNTNDAVILAGLDKSDRLYLSVPAGTNGSEISLIPEMNGKRRRDEPKEEEKKQDDGLITLPNGQVVKVPVSSQDGKQRQRPEGDAKKGDRRGGKRESTPKN